MSKSLKRVHTALEAAGLSSEIRQLNEGTRTAAAAAAALGCTEDQIAKSIIFHDAAADRIVLFVTAGGRRVDQSRANSLAGMPLSRAAATTVRRITGFAIGGVSPVGHLTAPRTFFDPNLMAFDVVWAAAGTPHHVFAAKPADLAEIIHAEVTDFSVQSKVM